MKKFTVYFEIFDKKMKASGIEATTKDQAERIVRHKLNILNIEEEIESKKDFGFEAIKDVFSQAGINL